MSLTDLKRSEPLIEVRASARTFRNRVKQVSVSSIFKVGVLSSSWRNDGDPLSSSLYRLLRPFRAKNSYNGMIIVSGFVHPHVNISRWHRVYKSRQYAFT